MHQSCVKPQVKKFIEYPSSCSLSSQVLSTPNVSKRNEIRNLTGTRLKKPNRFFSKKPNRFFSKKPNRFFSKKPNRFFSREIALWENFRELARF
jgi:hypothetical protein